MLRRLPRSLRRAMPDEIVRRDSWPSRLTSTVAIDYGASVGKIARHLSAAGAIVYVFKPNPHAFLVEARFAGAANVQCIQKDVHDEKVRMRLYLHKFSGETGRNLAGRRSDTRRKSRPTYRRPSASVLSQWFVKEVARSGHP